MAGIYHEWNGTILTITSDSGTSSCDLKGAKGDMGVRGCQGAAGVLTDTSGLVLANADNYYQKTEVDEKLRESETETDEKLSDLSTEVALTKISNDAKYNAYDKRLTNLEQWIAPSYFETDNSIAYMKNVPSGALPYAELSKVGGMAYKSKNLIPYPYANSSLTANGITFTVQADGGVLIKGTATAAASFYIVKETQSLREPIKAGTYTLGFYGTTNSNVKLTSGITGVGEFGTTTNRTLTVSSDTTYYLRIEVAAEATVNATYYPMLNEGNIALPYEPYSQELKETKVTKVESRGRNIWNGNWESGGIMANTGAAYPSTVTIRSADYLPVNPNTKYYIYRKSSDLKLRVFYFGLNKSWVDYKEIGAGAYEFTTTANTYFIKFQTVDWLMTDTDDGDLCISVSNTETNGKYYPYQVLSSIEIPEAVQELDGYGLGTKRNYQGKDYIYLNYVDFTNKKYITEVEKAVFDGTEAWTAAYTGENTFYKVRLNKNAKGNSDGVCSHFDFAQVGSTSTISGWFIENTMYPAVFRIRPDLNKFSTVEAWKTHLAELYANGTPLTLVYALAEPVITDISDHLSEDNYLLVDVGGTVIAENDEQLGAPTTITYQFKEGSRA